MKFLIHACNKYANKGKIQCPGPLCSNIIGLGIIFPNDINVPYIFQESIFYGSK